MKAQIIRFMMVAIICVAAAPAGLRAEDILDNLTVRDLVRKVETQYQGDTSKATMSMKVVTETWSREMSMESWSEGRDKFLVRILAPKKDRGLISLKIDEDMWNYLPKIDRVMKIPSSLMGENWMGSHLTNDDLVKSNKIDELYDFELIGRSGNNVKVLCTPLPDAAVVWGSIVYTVDIERVIPVTIEYYDEDGELVRTMDFEQVTLISGRWVPLVMRIRPIETPEEMTEIVYDGIEFDIPLDKDLFSLTTLRRK